jgi:hypothetical protein
MRSMERISGPYKGYFIAAYTVPAGDGFVGYAKICMAEPGDVWNAQSVEKLTSVTGCQSEHEAMVAAERKAREAIAEIVGSTDPVTAPGALN